MVNPFLRSIVFFILHFFISMCTNFGYNTLSLELRRAACQYLLCKFTALKVHLETSFCGNFPLEFNIPIAFSNALKIKAAKSTVDMNDLILEYDAILRTCSTVNFICEQPTNNI